MKKKKSKKNMTDILSISQKDVGKRAGILKSRYKKVFDKLAKM